MVGFKTIIDIENGKAKALNEKSIKLKAVLAQSFKIVQLIINWDYEIIILEEFAWIMEKL